MRNDYIVVIKDNFLYSVTILNTIEDVKKVKRLRKSHEMMIFDIPKKGILYNTFKIMPKYWAVVRISWCIFNVFTFESDIDMKLALYEICPTYSEKDIITLKGNNILLWRMNAFDWKF